MAVIYDPQTGKWYGISDEAKRLGISRFTLDQILKGKRKAGRSLARKIRIREVGAEEKRLAEVVK
jgi:hypothetical protein